jgi:MFS transporter, OFA family, oxalate/formate antiporter
VKRSKRRSFVHRLPFFYGWVIAAVATLGSVMTNPGQTPVVSIFIDRFIADLDISRSLVSTLYMVGSLVGGLSLSFWGMQIDRRGTRFMMTLIAGLLGVACIYMGFVNNAVMLGLGFVMLRMLGQGSLSLVSQTTINQWWVRRRGLVVGISGVAVSLLGLGAFPNVVQQLLARYEWRTTYAILGSVLLLGMAPLAFLFVRDRPEDYGLEPDGDPLAKEVPAPGAAFLSEEPAWTLGDAVRTPAFWVVGLSVALSALIGTGLFFHLVDIFQSHGLGPEVAAAVYLPISITAAMVRLASGYLADRWPLRYLLAGAMALMTVIAIMVQFLTRGPIVLVFGILLGIDSGLFQTVGGVIWADYFGRKHLGSIAGFASSLGTLGSALGPLPFALARDLLGTYDLALWIAAALPVALIVANIVVGPPTRSGARAQEAGV